MNHNQRIRFDNLLPIISEEISHGRSFTFTAFGSSMYPTIIGGKHRVTLSPLSTEAKIGDILFYRRPNGMYVLHRLCKIKEDGSFVFCGDNQYVLEYGIEKKHIIAIMTKLVKDDRDVTPTRFSQKLITFFLPLRRFWLHGKSFLKRIFKVFFT